jgi:hypothetical protein
MTTVTTFSGTFDPFNPRAEDVRWVDIARGLSRIPRWLGQTTEAYSVAEHSIMVACQCSDPLRLWGLLHDAAEAVLGDVLAPYKGALWFHVPDAQGVIRKRRFSDVEEDVLRVILAAAGIDVAPGAPVIPEEVKMADEIIRKWEHDHFVRPTPERLALTTMPAAEAAERWLHLLGDLTVQTTAAALEARAV